MQIRKKDEPYLGEPIRNDFKSPFCIMIVVQQLMLIEWDSYVSARELSTTLRSNYPQVSWDTVVVGRILGGLSTLASTMEHPGLGTEHIFKTTVGGASKYALNPNKHTWDWLRALHNALIPMAERRKLMLSQPFNWQDRDYDPRQLVWEDLESIGYAGVGFDPSTRE